jgi:hypothetical protein
MEAGHWAALTRWAQGESTALAENLLMAWHRCSNAWEIRTCFDDSEPDAPQIAGTLFRDWYQDKRPGQPDSIESKLVPFRLFYSYSHKDETMRDALEPHLTLLKRQGFIASWHDRRILAGQEWKGQIDRHLDEADISFS